MRYDNRRSAQTERPFCNYSRVNTSTINGALKKVFDRNNTVPRIHKQVGENLTVAVSQYGLQELNGCGRSGQRDTSLQ